MNIELRKRRIPPQIPTPDRKTLFRRNDTPSMTTSVPELTRAMSRAKITIAQIINAMPRRVEARNGQRDFQKVSSAEIEFNGRGTEYLGRTEFG